MDNNINILCCLIIPEDCENIDFLAANDMKGNRWTVNGFANGLVSIFAGALVF